MNVVRIEELMTSDEVDTINEARIVLKDINRRAANRGFDSTGLAIPAFQLGRLSEAIEIAANQLFNVLNTAHNLCDVPVTEQQMHLR